MVFDSIRAAEIHPIEWAIRTLESSLTSEAIQALVEIAKAPAEYEAARSEFIDRCARRLLPNEGQ